IEAVQHAASSDVFLTDDDRAWIGSLKDSLAGTRGVHAGSEICSLLLDGMQRRVAEAAERTWMHHGDDGQPLHFVVILDFGTLNSLARIQSL
ncbi:hypothetical protein, partial [Klebsiella pneumoniae]|uniref:hypothetical protein n=1 Tax=Klebsiella pneumoniae TaxID=573 RepID=UPI0025A26D59